MNWLLENVSAFCQTKHTLINSPLIQLAASVWSAFLCNSFRNMTESRIFIWNSRVCVCVYPQNPSNILNYYTKFIQLCARFGKYCKQWIGTDFIHLSPHGFLSGNTYSFDRCTYHAIFIFDDPIQMSTRNKAVKTSRRRHYHFYTDYSAPTYMLVYLYTFSSLRFRGSAN